jgi:glyoxylase-like metal-dependent hydrolase (beta-lactamase superfamily II)
MLTTKHPFFEFEKNTYEIDEFDCASIFVIVGEEKAFVLDTGVGIGDIKGVIEKITDKPYYLVISHGHGDHIGNIGMFDEIWINELDRESINAPFPVEGRKGYAAMIAEREHKSYPYSMDEDFPVWDKKPALHPLTDGQVFDLGGRKVTAYHCPGHTPGEMVFIDDATRILFAGDACNNNLMLGSRPGTPGFISIERAGAALRRILDMQGEKYDKVYNSHHDYRGFGAPLADDVLPNAVKCCEELVAGTADIVETPDPFDPKGIRKKKVAMCGKTMITFNEEGIYEPK